MRLVLVCIFCLAVGACTWVEPDAGGRSIRVAYDAAGTARCIDLRREITVSVKAEVLGVARDRLKVRDELESLARNEASRIEQADTVRAITEPEAGEQSFRVYDCR